MSLREYVMHLNEGGLTHHTCEMRFPLCFDLCDFVKRHIGKREIESPVPTEPPLLFDVNRDSGHINRRLRGRLLTGPQVRDPLVTVFWRREITWAMALLTSRKAQGDLEQTHSESAARTCSPKPKAWDVVSGKGVPPKGVKGVRCDSRRRTSSQVFGAPAIAGSQTRLTCLNSSRTVKNIFVLYR